MKEKGIYFFGGKEGQEGTLNNDIWILKIGKKPLEWMKPQVYGSPPCPRHSHTMNFYEVGNFLIVHGGRNDYKNDSFALNDTFVFELSKFEWSEVKLYFNTARSKVYNRCSHSSLIYSIKFF